MSTIKELREILKLDSTLEALREINQEIDTIVKKTKKLNNEIQEMDKQLDRVMKKKDAIKKR